MNRLSSALSALTCALLSAVLLAHSMFGTKWISGCIPLTAIVMGGELEKSPSASFPDLQWDDKIRILQQLDVMDQQIVEEKNWLYEKLKSKKVCLNQGFFAYCLKGDGFFELGDYQLCITTSGSKKRWTRSGGITMCVVAATGLVSCFSVVLLSTSLFTLHIQRNKRASELLLRAASLVSFLSGTMIFLSLLPIAIQAVSYSFNTTNFYNDILEGLGNAYFVAMKVDWVMKDGDLTSSQEWARKIVSSMSDLGVDRDFFLALSAGVFHFVACAALLVRPRSETQEKYGVGFGSTSKLS